jgi:hypothetical protein
MKPKEVILARCTAHDHLGAICHKTVAILKNFNEIKGDHKKNKPDCEQNGPIASEIMLSPAFHTQRQVAIQTDRHPHPTRDLECDVLQEHGNEAAKEKVLRVSKIVEKSYAKIIGIPFEQ